MNTFIDIAILAIPAAMALHLAICFVAKYGIWVQNGKSFRLPEAELPTPAPQSPPATDLPLRSQPESAPEIPKTEKVAILDDLGVRKLRKLAIALNKGLDIDHPNRISKVAQRTKAELISQLLPRWDVLGLA